MDEHTKPEQQPEPPVTAEVAREVEERMREERYDEQRKTARAATTVLQQLHLK